MPGSWSDYLELRTGVAPPPSPEAGDVRVYADSGGVLRAVQSDGTDAAIGGGGSSFVPVSCLLRKSTTSDIHSIGAHELTWDQVYPSFFLGTPLGSLPDGLGLTIALDGSSPAITATESGVWVFDLQLALVTGADVTLRAAGFFEGMNAGVDFGLLDANAWGGYISAPSLCETAALSTTTGTAVSINVAAAATANPYEVLASLAITRLA